jgi:flagellum-specific ATP synthase
MDDPIADAARSILDGHFVLSRRLAQRNHFPALDVLQSASRVFRSVTDPNHQDWVGKIREWMALYAQAEDLINIGAYARGANAKVDQAVAVIDRIQAFLRQGVDEKSSLAETQAMLHSICRAAESALQSGEAGRK